METLDRAEHSIAMLCPSVYIPQIIVDLYGSASLLSFRTCYLAGAFANSSHALSIPLVLSIVQLAYAVRSLTAIQANSTSVRGTLRTALRRGLLLHLAA